MSRAPYLSGDVAGEDDTQQEADVITRHKEARLRTAEAELGLEHRHLIRRGHVDIHVFK